MIDCQTPQFTGDRTMTANFGGANFEQKAKQMKMRKSISQQYPILNLV